MPFDGTTRRRVLLGTGAAIGIGLAGCLGGDDDAGTGDDDAQVHELTILDRTDHEPVAGHHDGHWHGELPVVPLEDSISIGVEVEGEDGEIFDLEFDYEIVARSEDDAIVTAEGHGDHVHLYGAAVGTADIVFEIHGGGELVYETVAIEATVEE